MAALARSAVTITRTWQLGGTGRKDITAAQVVMVLTGQGTLATNNIPATLFGLTKLVRASSFINSDSTVVYKCVPSYDGAYLLFTLAAAGDTPADVTATVTGVIEGY